MVDGLVAVAASQNREDVDPSAASPGGGAEQLKPPSTAGRENQEESVAIINVSGNSDLPQPFNSGTLAAGPTLHARFVTPSVQTVEGRSRLRTSHFATTVIANYLQSGLHDKRCRGRDGSSPALAATPTVVSAYATGVTGAAPGTAAAAPGHDPHLTCIEGRSTASMVHLPAGTCDDNRPAASLSLAASALLRAVELNPPTPQPLLEQVACAAESRTPAISNDARWTRRIIPPGIIQSRCALTQKGPV